MNDEDERQIDDEQGTVSRSRVTIISSSDEDDHQEQSPIIPPLTSNANPIVTFVKSNDLENLHSDSSSKNLNVERRRSTKKSPTEKTSLLNYVKTNKSCLCFFVPILIGLITSAIGISSFFKGSGTYLNSKIGSVSITAIGAIVAFVGLILLFRDRKKLNAHVNSRTCEAIDKSCSHDNHNDDDSESEYGFGSDTLNDSTHQLL